MVYRIGLLHPGWRLIRNLASVPAAEVLPGYISDLNLVNGGEHLLVVTIQKRTYIGVWRDQWKNVEKFIHIALR